MKVTLTTTGINFRDQYTNVRHSSGHYTAECADFMHILSLTGLQPAVEGNLDFMLTCEDNEMFMPIFTGIEFSHGVAKLNFRAAKGSGGFTVIVDRKVGITIA